MIRGSNCEQSEQQGSQFILNERSEITILERFLFTSETSKQNTFYLRVKRVNKVLTKLLMSETNLQLCRGFYFF